MLIEALVSPNVELFKRDLVRSIDLSVKLDLSPIWAIVDAVWRNSAIKNNIMEDVIHA